MGDVALVRDAVAVTVFAFTTCRQIAGSAGHPAVEVAVVRNAVAITSSRLVQENRNIWFGTEEEIKKADESRDEETRKELESLAEGASEQAEDSILPLPERDAEQIERDFEVLEKTEEQF